MVDLEVFQRADRASHKTAIIDQSGHYSYADLRQQARAWAHSIQASPAFSEQATVGFMVPPGFDYAAILWGIWEAGGIAVPLPLDHPLTELEHRLQDAGIKLVISAPQCRPILEPLSPSMALQYLDTPAPSAPAQTTTTEPGLKQPAMILYTSGTTGKPKGVVYTHAMIKAQVEMLAQAWQWSPLDHTLLVLPLHHIHGLINILTCALWSGATCEILPKFSPKTAFEILSSGRLTLFMAVPTIYTKLIKQWHESTPCQQQAFQESCKKMRLMVSGSAALPTSTLEKWEQISTHRLLERYGMTEIGMALSNPLQGQRRAGYVGKLLPGVSARRVLENGQLAAASEPAELQVQGPTVFQRYWNNPSASTAAFQDGWFCTGDITVIEEGYYRILGRRSIDIIKSGGFKISALEIEEQLREHPAINDCAVIGLPDEVWGEVVTAVVVLAANQPLSLNTLKLWCKDRLAHYKHPQKMALLDELPRNSMGKVEKQQLKKQLQQSIPTDN